MRYFYVCKQVASIESYHLIDSIYILCWTIYIIAIMLSDFSPIPQLSKTENTITLKFNYQI